MVRASTLLVCVLAVLSLAVACDGDGAGTAGAPDGVTADTVVGDEADTQGGEPDVVTPGELDVVYPDLGGPDTGAPQTCGSCHGTDDLPSPPPALDGSTEPTHPKVGAHAVHLTDAPTWRSRTRCQHCHTVPATIDAEGHLDGTPGAEVVFSGLASAFGEVERRADGSCAVYCHGGGLRIEQFVSPAWDQPGTLGCDACHGMPPAAPHPQEVEGCGACHIDVADEDGGIAIGRYHIDSILQAPHGAHFPHLGGDGSVRLACSECHSVPNYHGPLKDGSTLADTTLCFDCHAEGEVDPAEWLTYDGIGRALERAGE